MLLFLKIKLKLDKIEYYESFIDFEVLIVKVLDNIEIIFVNVVEIV